MTGRKILIKILSWNYSDFLPRNDNGRRNMPMRKHWGKMSRNYLKKESNKEILKQLED